jgi:hypothetical protein
MNRTIPQLEFAAAVLMLKYLQLVLDAHNIPCHPTHVSLYSDSTVALAWIGKKKTAKILYVDNCIQLIKDNPFLDFWHYIPLAPNPADLLTKPTKPSNLRENILWWNRPEIIMPTIRINHLITKAPREIKFDPIFTKLISQKSSFHTLSLIVELVITFCKNLIKTVGRVPIPI